MKFGTNPEGDLLIIDEEGIGTVIPAVQVRRLKQTLREPEKPAVKASPSKPESLSTPLDIAGVRLSTPTDAESHELIVLALDNLAAMVAQDQLRVPSEVEKKVMKAQGEDPQGASHAPSDYLRANIILLGMRLAELELEHQGGSIWADSRPWDEVTAWLAARFMATGRVPQKEELFTFMKRH